MGYSPILLAVGPICCKLSQVFRGLLARFEAGVFTIDECMSTIMPLAGTTACLPLSTLNDAGFVAFRESDYGAAPKVEMRSGQVLTVINPDVKGEQWIGLRTRILEAPSRSICRSQIDVEFDVDSARLAEEMRGFHWMLVCGDYLREVGYVLKKTPLTWRRLA